MIRVHRHAAVGTIALDRPAALNAFDLPMLEAPRTAVNDAVGDPEVRAIVLTGGARAFCTGEDLRAALLGTELVERGVTSTTWDRGRRGRGSGPAVRNS